MNSDSNEQQIYDIIRNEWVAALPEEIIRQKLVAMMIEDKGFPKELISVEKSLRDMPHLTDIKGSLPDRRVDIVAFAKGIHPSYNLYPLLVVECKAVKITEKVISQVTGYNHYMKACFVAVANDTELRTGWDNNTLDKYTFIEGMPTYDELVAAIQTPNPEL